MATVEGICEPRFHAVEEQLAVNFAERGEVGASVCVLLDGEPVVDLWGGVADRADAMTLEARAVVQDQQGGRRLLLPAGHGGAPRVRVGVG